MVIDDTTVEGIVDNANMRLMCVASQMRFVQSAALGSAGHPQVDLVRGDNDDEPVSTIPASMLDVLVRTGQMTAYVETTARAVARARGIGEEIGRDRTQRELRRLIGIQE